MEAQDSFETYRSLLFSIAYRMTGSVMEAEDLVQDTYLRYNAADPGPVHSLKAYLTTILTRQAINVLQSSRIRRESYLGPWLPEPLLTAGSPHLTDQDRLIDSISPAFLLVMERLTPLERAVFLLHEVFDYRYSEIAHMLERTEAACRKLGTRAKQHVQQHPRYIVSNEDYQRVIGRFLEACQTGNLEGLVTLLAQDATIYSDGGGKAKAGTRPVSGQEIVAKFILGGLRVIADQDYTWEILELNGRPAIVVRINGAAFGVVQFEINASQSIEAIHFITNPDKIDHL